MRNTIILRLFVGLSSLVFLSSLAIAQQFTSQSKQRISHRTVSDVFGENADKSGSRAMMHIDLGPHEGAYIRTQQGERSTLFAAIPPTVLGRSVAFAPPAESEADSPIVTTIYRGYIVQFAKAQSLMQATVHDKNTSHIKAARIAIDKTAADFESVLKAKKSDALIIRHFSRLFAGAAVANVSIQDLDALKAEGVISHYWPNFRVKTALNISAPIVHAPEMWKAGYTGKGINIGVIDTGIDYTHAAFGSCSQASYLSGRCTKVKLGYDFVDEDRDPFDCHGHGTHVASIAAGRGVLPGIAPGATITPIRVLGCGGAGEDAGLIAAVEFSVDPNGDDDFSDHLDIINLSLTSEDFFPDFPLPVVLDRASSIGVITSVAAGNSGHSSYPGIYGPASARSAIAVGASENARDVAEFSSGGPIIWTPDGSANRFSMVKPDLIAPGMGICAARVSNSDSSSSSCETFANGLYTAMSGTSMAAPHVAGAVAILKEAHPNWNLSRIRSALRATASTIRSRFGIGPYSPLVQGAGLINIYAASKVIEPVSMTIEPVELTGRLEQLRGHITTEGPVTSYVEIARKENYGSLSEWTVLHTEQIAAGTSEWAFSLDLAPLEDADYIVRWRVIDQHHQEFSEFAYVERHSASIASPEKYETINPDDPLTVQLSIHPLYEIERIIPTYRCDSQTTFQPADSLVDTTNPLSPTVTFVSGFFASCKNVFIRIQTEFVGAHAAEETRQLRSESSLLPGFPARIVLSSTWYPVTVYGTYRHSFHPGVGDVLGDADQEIVLISNGVESNGDSAKVVIIDRHGHIAKEIHLTGQNLGIDGPLALMRSSTSTLAPVLLDLDRDGKLDIIVPVFKLSDENQAGYLFAFRGDGSVLPGWPISAPWEFDYAITASDVDNDGRPEIIYGAKSGTLIRILDYRGREISSFAAGSNHCHRDYVWSPVSLPIAVTMEGSPNKRIVTVDADNHCGENGFDRLRKNISVREIDGTLISQTTIPYEWWVNEWYTRSSVTGVDIIGNKDPELVVPMQSFTIWDKGVFAYTLEGDAVPGFPLFSNDTVFSLPTEVTAGDIDGDSVPEIIFNGNIPFFPPFLQIFRANGTRLPGNWPTQRPCAGQTSVDTILGGSLVTRDNLDRSIILNSNGPCIEAYNSEGSLMPDYPRLGWVSGNINGAGVLADLDNDGILEFISDGLMPNAIISSGTHYARLYVWQTNFPATRRRTDWLQNRRDRYQSGVYGAEPQEIFSIGGTVQFQGRPIKGMVIASSWLGDVRSGINGGFRLEQAKLDQRYTIKARLPDGGIEELMRLNPTLPSRPTGRIREPSREVTITGEMREDFQLE